jgi:hypothetical protein
MHLTPSSEDLCHESITGQCRLKMKILVFMSQKSLRVLRGFVTLGKTWTSDLRLNLKALKSLDDT